MIGKIISHYRIIEKLGSGGMGVVYKAKDTKLKRIVALKFLTPQALGSEEEKSRFVHEAQAAAALDHPNICTVYEIDEAEGQTFIVMAYIDGQSLKEKIESGPLKLDEALDIAILVAEGLQEAHEKGIVHRDIKSANIMTTEKGQAKIMDFGLAKLAERTKLTKTGTTMGTVSYMSPEQARGEEIDHRTDIWSLGVVLYEMVTGQMPFRGEYEQALVYSILNEDPEPMTGIRTGVPMELERIVNKCLEKEPSARYQHADELIVDLRRLKKETESGIIPSRRVVSAEIPRKRFQSFVVPGVLLFIAIIIVAGYFFFGRKAESKERIPIAIVDFVNETDEKELNGLSGMLITALEQSRRLSVLTRSRMFDILKQLGKKDVERIDEALGREIARQANINVLVLASIRKFDQLYTIDLKIIDPIKDKYLFTAGEKGEGKASVPSMIDRLAEKTRKGLKEKEEEIQAASQKVADVTTINLEAYHHYFKGEELVNKLKFKEAIEEFKKAIALDSTFGLAYYRLAYSIAWTIGQEHLAKPFMEKALTLIARIPEKERYLLRAENARIEQGYTAGIEVLRDMEKIYPNDKEMLYNIGDYSYHSKDFVTAAEYLEKVLDIDPSFQRALQHITWTYRASRQFDKALVYAKKYVSEAHNVEAYNLLAEIHNLTGAFPNAVQTYTLALQLFPDDPDLLAGLGNTYAFMEDFQTAHSILKSMTIESRPLEVQKRGYEELAQFYPYLGKYSDMVHMFDKRIDFALKENDVDLAAILTAEKAYWLYMGRKNKAEALEMIESTKSLGKITNPIYYQWLTLFYTEIGDLDRARAAREMIKFAVWGQIYRAKAHHAMKEWEQAILGYKKILDRVADEFQAYYRFLLAQCYFHKGDLNNAIQEIIRAQGIYLNFISIRSVTYPKGFYLLGRIYEKQGNLKLAIQSYEKFLELWKDADKDLPELVDAKVRLAELKGMAS